MLPYYFLTILSISTILFSNWIEKLPIKNKLNSLIIYLLCVTGIATSGFRFQTGGDWQTYEFWYESFELSNIFNSGVEWGWMLYTLIIKYVGINFNWYLLTTSLISNLLIFYALQRLIINKNLVLICVSFYCLITFYSMQMFYIRSGFSAGLFVLSIALWEKNKFKGFLAALISISIHQAAIIAIFLYIITRVFLFNRLYLLLAYFITYIVFIYIINTYAPEAYVSGNFSDIRILNLKQFIGGILLILLIYRIDFLKRKYSKQVISFSILCFTIPYLFDSQEVGSRVRLFYSLFDGAALTLALSSIIEKKYISIALFLFSLGFIFIFWSNPYTQSIYIPYKTWFFSD